MATSADPTETMKHTLRIYEAKLKIYNDKNEDLRKLTADQVRYGESSYSGIPEGILKWKAPLVAIYELTGDITNLLKTTEFALLKSQVTQFTEKINDFMNKKGLDYDAQSMWYMVVRHGACHLKWSEDVRRRRYLARHELNNDDYIEEDRNVPVYTTFKYQNEKCEIEATLTALQEELKTYASFTDTHEGGGHLGTADFELGDLLGRLKAEVPWVTVVKYFDEDINTAHAPHPGMARRGYVEGTRAYWGDLAVLRGDLAALKAQKAALEAEVARLEAKVARLEHRYGHNLRSTSTKITIYSDHTVSRV